MNEKSPEEVAIDAEEREVEIARQHLQRASLPCVSLSVCVYAYLHRTCVHVHVFLNAYSARMCRETVSLTLTFVRAQTFPLSLSLLHSLPFPRILHSLSLSLSLSLARSLPPSPSCSLSLPPSPSVTHSLTRAYTHARQVL